MGASQIIAVEPIGYRRELALKLGATTVLDPNVEGEGLVDKICDMCKGETNSIFGGGRDWGGAGSAHGVVGAVRARRYGPEFVIESVGTDIFPPKAGAGPDPTGANITALQQAYLMTDAIGHLTTTGVYHGDITLPARTFSISGRTHHGGQLGGGANTFRDMQRFVQLTEKKLYDAKSLATGIYSLEQTKEAFQAVADRTTVASVVVFS
jgi:threonine dehydrogenase-like Zn-dependent dehydrogenase